jgi:hypothetical protein
MIGKSFKSALGLISIWSKSAKFNRQTGKSGSRTSAISWIGDFFACGNSHGNLRKHTSLKDIENERKENREARDEWDMRLNSNLWFAETNFGSEARTTLEQDISGGFSKIHNEFNDLFKRKALDRDAAERIESEIDGFNPTIYVFDLKMEKSTTDRAALCNTQP